MKDFRELGIVPTKKSFTGDKIKIRNILNVEIIVHDYKVEPSDFSDKGDGKRLVLQIQKGTEWRIIFTSSLWLRDLVMRVPKDMFPFKATIIDVNDHFEFQTDPLIS